MAKLGTFKPENKSKFWDKSDYIMNGIVPVVLCINYDAWFAELV